MANPQQSAVIQNKIQQQSKFSEHKMSFDPAPDTSDKKLKENDRPHDSLLRRHVRVPANIRAVLYSKCKFQSVVIRNISRGGAGLDNCGHFVENDRVVISLLNNRRIEAKVRWWFAGVCGVQFNDLLDSTDILLTGRLSYTEVSKNTQSSGRIVR